MNEDDDEEDKGITAVRYPVMPSLVAQQQMNNRLHLAYLGKKLMKWTAQATRRELRNVAEKLIKAYDSFGEDIKNAYILLARARYFYPNLNKMVLGNIAPQATLTVRRTTKALTGVKMMQMEIMDNNIDPFPCLGIDKGGLAISEAKDEWKKLLCKMIVILKQKTAFIQIDIANKNATKRQNVIAKIIIPKIKVTKKFISSELEEKEREETFRLKQFKKLKYKNKGKNESNLLEECEDGNCGTPNVGLSTVDIPPEGLSDSDYMCEGCAEALKAKEAKDKEPIKQVKVETVASKGKPAVEAQEKGKSPPILKLPSAQKTPSTVKTPSAVKTTGVKSPAVEKTKSSAKDIIVPGLIISQKTIGDMSEKLQIDKIVITVSRGNNEQRMEKIKNVYDYENSVCEKCTTREFTPYPSDIEDIGDTKALFDNMSSHLGDLEGYTKEMKDKGISSPSIEKFAETCASMKMKIKSYVQESNSKKSGSKVCVKCGDKQNSALQTSANVKDNIFVTVQMGDNKSSKSSKHSCGESKSQPITASEKTNFIPLTITTQKSKDIDKISSLGDKSKMCNCSSKMEALKSKLSPEKSLKKSSSADSVDIKKCLTKLDQITSKIVDMKGKMCYCSKDNVSNKVTKEVYSTSSAPEAEPVNKVPFQLNLQSDPKNISITCSGKILFNEETNPLQSLFKNSSKNSSDCNICESCQVKFSEIQENKAPLCVLFSGKINAKCLSEPNLGGDGSKFDGPRKPGGGDDDKGPKGKKTNESHSCYAEPAPDQSNASICSSCQKLNQSSNESKQSKNYSPGSSTERYTYCVQSSSEKDVKKTESAKAIHQICECGGKSRDSDSICSTCLENYIEHCIKNPRKSKSGYSESQKSVKSEPLLTTAVKNLCMYCSEKLSSIKNFGLNILSSHSFFKKDSKGPSFPSSTEDNSNKNALVSCGVCASCLKQPEKVTRDVTYDICPSRTERTKPISTDINKCRSCTMYSNAANEFTHTKHKERTCKTCGKSLEPEISKIKICAACSKRDIRNHSSNTEDKDFNKSFGQDVKVCSSCLEHRHGREGSPCTVCSIKKDIFEPVKNITINKPSKGYAKHTLHKPTVLDDTDTCPCIGEKNYDEDIDLEPDFGVYKSLDADEISLDTELKPCKSCRVRLDEEFIERETKSKKCTSCGQGLNETAEKQVKTCKSCGMSIDDKSKPQTRAKPLGKVANEQPKDRKVKICKSCGEVIDGDYLIPKSCKSCGVKVFEKPKKTQSRVKIRSCCSQSQEKTMQPEPKACTCGINTNSEVKIVKPKTCKSCGVEFSERPIETKVRTCKSCGVEFEEKHIQPQVATFKSRGVGSDDRPREPQLRACKSCATDDISSEPQFRIRKSFGVGQDDKPSESKVRTCKSCGKDFSVKLAPQVKAPERFEEPQRKTSSQNTCCENDFSFRPAKWKEDDYEGATDEKQEESHVKTSSSAKRCCDDDEEPVRAQDNSPVKNTDDYETYVNKKRSVTETLQPKTCKFTGEVVSQKPPDSKVKTCKSCGKCIYGKSKFKEEIKSQQLETIEPQTEEENKALPVEKDIKPSESYDKDQDEIAEPTDVTKSSEQEMEESPVVILAPDPLSQDIDLTKTIISYIRKCSSSVNKSHLSNGSRKSSSLHSKLEDRECMSCDREMQDTKYPDITTCPKCAKMATKQTSTELRCNICNKTMDPDKIKSVMHYESDNNIVNEFLDTLSKKKCSMHSRKSLNDDDSAKNATKNLSTQTSVEPSKTCSICSGKIANNERLKAVQSTKCQTENYCSCLNKTYKDVSEKFGDKDSLVSDDFTDEHGLIFKEKSSNTMNSVNDSGTPYELKNGGSCVCSSAPDLSQGTSSYLLKLLPEESGADGTEALITGCTLRFDLSEASNNNKTKSLVFTPSFTCKSMQTPSKGILKVKLFDSDDPDICENCKKPRFKEN